jgi:hypothetical protein
MKKEPFGLSRLMYCPIQSVQMVIGSDFINVERSIMKRELRTVGKKQQIRKWKMILISQLQFKCKEQPQSSAVHPHYFRYFRLSLHMV